MSTKGRKLTKRQMAVIDELFTGGMDETEVLARHNVSTRLYRAWLDDELFADELKFRIDSARRSGELIIARYTPVAAAKLVGLIDSDKDETVRRACLDIMSAGRQTDAATTDQDDSNENQPDLPPELATKLLAVLAQHTDDSVTS
ncbi:MAG: hypothetical protein ACYSWP_20520 [Planctomycetota bacterium]|jgi:hypothetical protein